MDLHISPGSPADREWCAQLMAASDPWITLGVGIERCRAIFRLPEYELFVAQSDGRRQGFVLLHPRGAMGSPYVAILAVAPEVRGQGLGSRLLSFVEDHYRGRARTIFLCVSSFNQRARQLYERRGYRVMAELKDYVIEGASEILMQKWLR